MPITQLNNPNNALTEILETLSKIKERVRDLEIGTNIYYQLIIVDDYRINYLEDRCDQLENKLFYLGLALIILGVISIIRFFCGLFSSRNKKT